METAVDLYIGADTPRLVVVQHPCIVRTDLQRAIQMLGGLHAIRRVLPHLFIFIFIFSSFDKVLDAIHGWQGMRSAGTSNLPPFPPSSVKGTIERRMMNPFN